MRTQDLDKAIIKTVSYFNMFKLPLTDWEIYSNLYNYGQETSFADVKQRLDNLSQIKTLCFNEGFYFLPSNIDLVLLRKQRYLIAQKKIKIALRYIRLISKLPFVKAIFICNNLAFLNAQNDSDIDLAVVTKTNRIWTARFFSAGLMKILKQRPTPKKQKDKICLSFFVSENALNLESLAYQDDIHFTYWINQFMPVYDPDGYAEKFYQANQWARKQLPNLPPIQTNCRWTVENKNKTKKITEKMLNSWFGNIIEKGLKRLQLKILPDALKIPAKENNSNVIISDEVLKMHHKDKRMEVKDKWEASIKNNLQVCKN